MSGIVHTLHRAALVGAIALSPVTGRTEEPAITIYFFGSIAVPTCDMSPDNPGSEKASPQKTIASRGLGAGQVLNMKCQNAEPAQVVMQETEQEIKMRIKQRPQQNDIALLAAPDLAETPIWSGEKSALLFLQQQEILLTHIQAGNLFADDKGLRSILVSVNYP